MVNLSDFVRRVTGHSTSECKIIIHSCRDIHIICKTIKFSAVLIYEIILIDVPEFADRRRIDKPILGFIKSYKNSRIVIMKFPDFIGRVTGPCAPECKIVLRSRHFEGIPGIRRGIAVVGHRNKIILVDIAVPDRGGNIPVVSLPEIEKPYGVAVVEFPDLIFLFIRGLGANCEIVFRSGHAIALGIGSGGVDCGGEFSAGQEDECSDEDSGQESFETCNIPFTIVLFHGSFSSLN
jgi:hypothetical protein